MNPDLDQIGKLSYSVIRDKSLTHQDFLFKLIIIGDTGKVCKDLILIGVGKSCLLARITDNQFRFEH